MFNLMGNAEGAKPEKARPSWKREGSASKGSPIKGGFNLMGNCEGSPEKGSRKADEAAVSKMNQRLGGLAMERRSSLTMDEIRSKAKAADALRAKREGKMSEPSATKGKWVADPVSGRWGEAPRHDGVVQPTRNAPRRVVS
jgi:hypothetical protein